MVGTFRTDEAQLPNVESEEPRSVIGLRMPYDTPLQQYGREEIPWVATMIHSEPDWMGRTLVD